MQLSLLNKLGFYHPTSIAIFLFILSYYLPGFWLLFKDSNLLQNPSLIISAYTIKQFFSNH